MKPMKSLLDTRGVASTALLAVAALFLISAAPAIAAVSLNGQVLGAGAPITNSTVTLYSASAGAPKQLAQAKTGAGGRFTLNAADVPGKEAILYVVAKGGTPAANKAGGNNSGIALLSVLGATPPKTVTINELTTVASAFTAAQFINGEAISGNPLGLRIAAGNAPNLVDPATGK